MNFQCQSFSQLCLHQGIVLKKDHERIRTKYSGNQDIVILCYLRKYQSSVQVLFIHFQYCLNPTSSFESMRKNKISKCEVFKSPSTQKVACLLLFGATIFVAKCLKLRKPVFRS